MVLPIFCTIEGGGTSGAGGALPPSVTVRGMVLPVTEGDNAPPAPDVPPPSMVQKIGNTIYEVSFHFSTTSRETMGDKINRLIRRDLEAS